MNQRQGRIVYVSLGIYAGDKVTRAPEVRAQQNLAALVALGYEIKVITCPDQDGRPVPDFPTTVVDPVPSNTFLNFNACWSYHRKVARVVQSALADPDTILFCEHWPALICSPPHLRTLYSCHDLESDLMRYRRQRKKTSIKIRTRLYWWLAAILERRMLQKAQHAICVSATEAEKIRTNQHLPAEYVPTVPVSVPHIDFATDFNEGVPRFWFYGNSSATSNKIVLDHLADELFDLLQSAIPLAEFHQVGPFKTYDADKIAWLQQHFCVHGFVDDPGTLFRPGDFCLIPYQQDTGFRTKIPEACGYGMIPVGYHVSFACCPEMRDGYNCVAAATSGELVEKLVKVSADPALRRSLAAGAVETRRVDFSFAKLLDRYQRALDFTTP